MRIRDTIHGMVQVSPLEMKIINTPAFQRLRYIRQLATTYMVYPGAEHTRFGHSIGTMHIASRVIQSIKQKNPACFFKKKKEQDAHWAWMEQMLRLMALTHDLGHPPFSHAGEGLLPKSKKHEDYTQRIIMETEIKDIINEIGDDFKKQYGSSSFEISAEKVVETYRGGKDRILNNYECILNYLMDSELDCDKMDYLLRDSHYCGVNYGHYDLERLLTAIDITSSIEDESVKVVAIHDNGIHAFEEFVLARYFMFLQVYFHKTRRILDITLNKYLKEILPKGQYPIKTIEYLKWDDNRVLQSMNMSNKGIDSIIQFNTRMFPRMIYQTSAHVCGKDDETLLKIKKQLVDKGICTQTDIIEDDASKVPHNIPALISEGEKAVYVIKDKVTTNIRNVSFVLNHISEPIHIKRIYVPWDKKNEAQELVTRCSSISV